MRNHVKLDDIVSLHLRPVRPWKRRRAQGDFDGNDRDDNGSDVVLNVGGISRQIERPLPSDIDSYGSLA